MSSSSTIISCNPRERLTARQAPSSHPPEVHLVAVACAAPRRSAWQPRTVLLAPLAAPSGQIENQMFSQQRRAAPAGQTAPPSTPDGGGRTVPRRRGICRARARILRLVSHHHSPSLSVCKLSQRAAGRAGGGRVRTNRRPGLGASPDPWGRGLETFVETCYPPSAARDLS